MENRFLLLVTASIISGSAIAQVKQDTVYVKSTPVVDTVKIETKSTIEKRTDIVSVKDGEDTVVVKVGSKSLYVLENPAGDVSVWTSKKERKSKKFNSHLDGFGLGVNVYLNKDLKMKFPAGYEGLDLNVSKSMNVVINILNVSQPIIGNTFGFTAGVGTEWHNFRFNDNVTLVKDATNRVVKVEKLPENDNVVKSKLTDWWLNFPVAFEVNGGKFSSFYVTAGAVGSILLNSHTKVVTDNGSKVKEKVWNQAYLNPFRVSLMAKVGYGSFGVYATYALTQMFQDGKGPELYPFAAGITLNF